MRTSVIIIAVVVGLLAAYVGYNYLNQPLSTGDRVGNAVDQLGNGNLGEAGDELGNQTVGDKIGDDLKDTTAPVAPQNQ